MSWWNTPWLLVALLTCARPAAAFDVTGRVLDNRGAALTNLPVHASYYDFNTPTQSVVFTDVAGRFSLSNILGYWNLQVPAESLNARGYLGISALSGSGSVEGAQRFVTRRLDFTHRIVGHLVDELGQPLAGHTLTARIVENSALFATNVVTDATGTFRIAATPAVWTLCCLGSPAGPARAFGEHDVEVPVASTEREITLAAPAVTGTISVSTVWLGGRLLVAETEAFNTRYRLSREIPLVIGGPPSPPLPLEVFNGLWRVSVTDQSSSVPALPFTAALPVVIAVTNQTVAIVLSNTPSPGPALFLQPVRVVTAAGNPVTNASVSAGSSGPVLPPVPGGSEPSPGYQLSLPAGPTILRVSTSVYPEWFGWDISQPITVAAHPTNAEITVVVPEPGQGPRLHGIITSTDGPTGDEFSVRLRKADGQTNYGTSLPTDASGRYGTNVPPGRWKIEVRAGLWQSSAAVVSNQDVAVDFVYAIPVLDPAVPVHVRMIDDAGESARGAFLYLQRDGDFVWPDPNGEPASMHPGLWDVGLVNSFVSGATPDYRLQPSHRWQLHSGVEASNLTVVVRNTPVRIEGQLRDEQGRLLRSGYASAWTSVDGTNFWANGSIASGYFSLNVFPGEWQVGVGTSRYPALGSSGGLSPFPGPGQARGSVLMEQYAVQAPRFVLATGEVTRCDFVATNLPQLLQLTVTLVREDNGPLEGATLVALTASSQGTQTADALGTASFQVTPGRVSVSGLPSADGLEFAPVFWPKLELDLQAASNHVTLVARQSTICLPVTLAGAALLGLQPQVRGTARGNHTNYSSSAFLGVDGTACLPVFPGAWEVDFDGYYLAHNSVQAVTRRTITVPPAGGVPSLDFEIHPLVDDFRTARLLAPRLQPDGRLRLEMEVRAPTGWRVERSGNLRDWTRIGIEHTDHGLLIVEDPTPDARSAFYRAVWAR